MLTKYNEYILFSLFIVLAYTLSQYLIINKIIINTLLRLLIHILQRMKKIVLIGSLLIIQSLILKSQATINVSNDEMIDVKKSILCFKQGEGQGISIDDILNNTNEGIAFNPLNKNAISDFLTGVLWIKFSVNNQTSQRLFIDFNPIVADSISLYTADENGQMLKTQTGQLMPFNERSIEHTNQNLELLGQKNMNQVYYIRLVSSLSTSYRIRVGTEKAILKNYHSSDVFYGFFYGFIVLVILLNFSIYFAQRTALYIWYAFYMLSMLCMLTSFNGNMHEWFFYDTPQYNPALYIFNTIPSILACIFTMYLLQVKNLLPAYYKVLIFIVFAKIAVFLYSFYDIQFGINITHFLAIPIISMTLFVAYQSWKKGNFSAKYYMLGGGLRLLAIAIIYLKNFEIISWHIENERILYTGILLEVLFLTIAIAHRFKILATEKEEVQKHAIFSLSEKQNIINKQNQLLEQRVNERTSELQLALKREKEKEEKMMRSNRELTEFASIVSHDLRAPLRNINSFTQILIKRNKLKFDDKDFEYAQFIQSGVRQSTQLIEDLLNYSRMDKNIGDPIFLDLNELVLDILNNNSHYLGEKNASFEINTLPQVKGHASLLTLIWQNLIFNGLKYNDSEQPNITVGCDNIKGKTTFWVCDNGIGIDSQYQEEIFRMFRRLHTSDKYEGTGIGLAFCKRVVEYYDGHIYFESATVNGTTFFFTLPKILYASDSIAATIEKLNTELLVAA